MLMKIVHVNQYYNDNMGYHDNILPYYQVQLGHEVVILTSTLSNAFDNNERIKQQGQYEEKGFKIRRVAIKGEFRNRFVIFKDLAKYLEEEKPDYIYHHSVTCPSLKTICSYKRNNPSVFIAVDNHADLTNSGRNKIYKKIYYNLYWRRQLKKLDEYINVFFGVTPNRCLFLKEELGVSECKIRLLPIGSDVKSSYTDIIKEDFLDKHHIDQDCFIIAHGGKITPDKRIGRIIKALIKIKNEKIRLVLFGNISDAEVAKLITQDSRILNIGWLNRKDTLALLKYSDIGIWDAHHTTLLEDAITMELPLIIRYSGNTSHLIDNSGMFLYEGSEREIQDKLLFLINNPEIVDKFKINVKKVRDILSYENIAYESIRYKETITPQCIHQTFMSEDFTDWSYKHLKRSTIE